MFKSQLMKLKSPKQNIDQTTLEHLFAPDYCTTVLVAKVCTNPHEYSI
jgi:hypothetical protein